MAVALSSVTNGSIVKIPMADGTTTDWYKCQYNHYGKGEVCLVAKDALMAYRNVGIEDINWSPDMDEYEYRYAGAQGDLACAAIIPTLAQSIQNALTYVSIPCAPIHASGSAMVYNTTVNIPRAVFLPSMKEIASSSSYWNGSVEIPAEGSEISGLRSAMETILERATYTRYSTLRSLGYKNDTANYFRIYGYLQTITTYNSKFSIYATIDSCPVRPIMTLNGSVMVNSSSGGAITESSAVESYRKINGKWYRTT